MRKIICIVLFSVSYFARAENPDLPVDYMKLSNGLRVVLVQNRDVAVASCRLYYFVGSIYEGPGTSGLSHMYEHMMFKGTKTLGTTGYSKEIPYINKIDKIAAEIQNLRNSGIPDNDKLIVDKKKEIYGLLDLQRKFIKKDEIWQIYLKNGGMNLNAWTSDFMTAYLVTLPKNRTELFYWIESDRMQNPVLREFYSERDVVAEERRMRYDNQPVNTYFENLMSHFYTVHPYRIPTIGYMSDILSYSRKRMDEHVRRYYTPDNAMIVIAGNIDFEAEKIKIKEYFGGIARAAEPRPQVVTREPEPAGEVRFSMKADAEPRIDIMFHVPGYPNEDLFALDVVEGLLDGRNGRLYKRLVEEDKLCTDAGAGNTFRLHNGFFIVSATLRNGVSVSAVEDAIFDEIEKLKKNLPDDSEMERVKNSIRFTYYYRLKSLEGISDQIARFEALGSWKDYSTYTDKILSVNKTSVRDMALKYFIRGKQATGILVNDKNLSGGGN